MGSLTNLIATVLYSCFLLPMKRAHLELPYLARESELWTLDLPAKRKVEYMRCHNSEACLPSRGLSSSRALC